MHRKIKIYAIFYMLGLYITYMQVNKTDKERQRNIKYVCIEEEKTVILKGRKDRKR